MTRLLIAVAAVGLMGCVTEVGPPPATCVGGQPVCDYGCHPACIPTGARTVCELYDDGNIICHDGYEARDGLPSEIGTIYTWGPYTCRSDGHPVCHEDTTIAPWQREGPGVYTESRPGCVCP